MTGSRGRSTCRRFYSALVGLSLAHLALLWTHVAQHGDGRLVSSGCSASYCGTAERGEANGNSGLRGTADSEELIAPGRGLLGPVGRDRTCFGASCRSNPRRRGSALVANRKRRDFQAHQGRRDSSSSYASHGRHNSNVTVVSLVHGLPEEIIHNITANHLGWAEAWGYRYCQFRGILDWSRPPPWSKVVALASVLECTESEWVMWIDIDAIFATVSVSLAGVLAAIEQGENEARIARKDALFSQNFRASDGPLNSGVFLLRNTPYSAQLLQRIYNNVTLEVVHHPWWENKALNDFFTEERDEFEEHCLAVPPRWFNQHRRLFQPGDLVVHYAGMHNRYPRIVADLASKGRGFEWSTSFDGATLSLNSTRCGPFTPLWADEAPSVEARQSADGTDGRDERPSRLVVPPPGDGRQQRCHEASCPFHGSVTLEKGTAAAEASSRANNRR